MGTLIFYFVLAYAVIIAAGIGLAYWFKRGDK